GYEGLADVSAANPSLYQSRDWSDTNRSVRRRLQRPRPEAVRYQRFRAPWAISPPSQPEAVRAPETAATHTDAILRTLAATFSPDQRRGLTLNDAIDFLHAAVPAAFCDAVLLDGAAWDAVERTRRNLPEIATAFSGRGDGVEQFLSYLA